ncbi:MAG: indole-3-glycerol phosphate synthase TrpC [Acidobacteria bacterium]|nr:indole-3-glycerol phosphate synthase TrpC [Acidobacteriota bacterium]
MTAGTPSVLDAIVAAAHTRVDVARVRVPLAHLERQLADARATGRGSRPSFAQSLAAPGIRVIAECKRRSPSKGVLRQTYDPVAIAGAYAAAGAAAVSVLTEPTFFDGALEHLINVRRAQPSLPLLRKDFTVDEYQIAEAAVAGASAVLLIVAALDQVTLARLLAYADDVGLDVLTEVHDEDEARRAIDAGATIVGVNNRNLKTLAVSIETSRRIAPIVASARVRVAESGLRTGEDLARLREAGYHAFLMGERFMTEPEPGAALARVMADADAAGEAPR